MTARQRTASQEMVREAVTVSGAQAAQIVTARQGMVREAVAMETVTVREEMVREAELPAVVTVREAAAMEAVTVREEMAREAEVSETVMAREEITREDVPAIAAVRAPSQPLIRRSRPNQPAAVRIRMPIKMINMIKESMRKKRAA